MDYVVFVYMFSKVPVVTMTESSGGKYNCIFGIGCQKSHIHKLGHLRVAGVLTMARACGWVCELDCKY